MCLSIKQLDCKRVTHNLAAPYQHDLYDLHKNIMEGEYVSKSSRGEGRQYHTICLLT